MFRPRALSSANNKTEVSVVMKIKIRRKANQIGAALLVALVIGSILCISVVGYLSVTEQQTLLSARSQAWNMAISIVEAGIEEGLQHANSRSEERRVGKECRSRW